jgi:hypothetical protein
MVQLVIFGMSILCLLAGIVTLVTGKISLTKSAPLQGASARYVGAALIAVAAFIAFFAEWIFPMLIR